MKHKSFCIALAALLIIAFTTGVQASPGSITRAISPTTAAPGDTVTVTLNVDVVSGERFYIIDETPPPGWEIQNEGELIKDPQGHLKIVTLQNAEDKAYTYLLKAPSSDGPYSFSGIYQIDGMDSPTRISGQSTVQVSFMAVDMNIVIAFLVIIIVLILVIVYLKRSKQRPM